MSNGVVREQAPTESGRPESGRPESGRPDSDALLSVRDLSVEFRGDRGTVRALDRVSFDIARGEVLAVVGESGSGKSVTAMSLLRLLPSPPAVIQAEGIWWKGQDLQQLDDNAIRRIRGREIAMVFQDPLSALNPVHTIGRQIGEVARTHDGVSRRTANRIAIDMLGRVGIPQPERRVDSYPHEFSGGMRQRVMIAMALTLDPELIIADEPTTALDVTVQAQVLDLLVELVDRAGAAVMLITHDLGVVAGMADRVMVMYAGRQAEMGTADQVYYRPRHPYTLGLLASLPRLDDDGSGPLRPIRGAPPSLVQVPSGCPFHPRCDHARLPDPCATDRPEFRPLGPSPHHTACHFAEELDIEHRPAAPVGAPQPAPTDRPENGR